MRPLAPLELQRRGPGTRPLAPLELQRRGPGTRPLTPLELQWRSKDDIFHSLVLSCRHSVTLLAPLPIVSIQDFDVFLQQ